MKFDIFYFIILIHFLLNTILTLIYFGKIKFIINLNINTKVLLEKVTIILISGFFICTLLILTFYIFQYDEFISFWYVISFINLIISYLTILKLILLLKQNNF
jgi:hypothetical protein